MTVGFMGIGTMGLPMAGRLLDAGVPLTVWNRTRERCEPLRVRGATVVDSVDALFERCAVVLVMLSNEQAVDATLGRETPAFARRVRGRIVAMLGTTSPEYSQALEAQLRACGGQYVEAPVSGSRVPAETGALIGMTAGDAAAVHLVAPLLAALCRQVVPCGVVPSALRMKLAVNHYLIVLVTALAESVRAAAAAGCDLEKFRQVLDAGPMASLVSTTKLDKMVRGDFAPQAAIRDVAQIASLIRDQARSSGVEAPLLDIAERLFDAARERGLSDLDMAAVLHPAPFQREVLAS
ncbi:MAG: NAD(P)-dependent oxidoreductase [Lysobacter sp.]|nr:NAD(P)-dependent oxidoreductase [Lysobacter sp.]MDQ3511865.1 NAD(P)-dependent oxidoreductase [Pseudomonadota bacterium]